MLGGARRLTMEEFFHCYRLAKIGQSKGVCNFVPISPSLRLVCDTLDSNKNWKSRYFFMKGDEWMCHPSENEYMPIDTTWGIMLPSDM